MSTDAPLERPLRADAVRNRARILEAAAELFSERGLGTTLNDIAHHAGVGVGTVYRHFPDRDELMRTLLGARIDELVATAEAGLRASDPWQGLVNTLSLGLQLQASDRGLRELIHDSPRGLEQIMGARERMLPLVVALVERVKDAGALRADIEPTDIPMLQLMVVSVIDASRDVSPDVWRRYLALVLRGIAADPDSLGPLPSTPVSPDDLDRVMTATPPPPR